LIRLLRWLPACAAAAYLATFAVLGAQIVDDVGWDTDASGLWALADSLRGSGPVTVAHAGDWIALWWMLATRALPWHEQLWEASGYVFAVGAALVVAWATAGVAGRWAGVTAGALAIVIIGPFSVRALISLSAHTLTPLGVVALGVGMLLLTRTSWWPVALVGMFAGATAASDALLWFAGVVPFALAGALFAWSARRRDVGVRTAITLGVALASAVATSVIMRALDFHTIPVDAGLESVRDFPSNIVHLGRMIALFGGANYATLGAYPREPLRALLALLVFAAAAAPVVAAVWLTIRRVDPVTRAYAWFWGAAAAVLCFVFVVTPNAADLGPKSSNYLLTLAPAAGVGVALLATTQRRQIMAAVAVATIAVINIGSMADGRAEGTGLVIQQYEQPLREVLDREGITRGYAGYWGAQNLSWQTGMRILVAPVSNCGDELCPNKIFTIRSWYEPRGGPTFLLVDPTVNFIHAPPFAARAKATHRFGPMTLYVFDYDIARHIRVAAG
jgi:hypothetical protein